MNFTVYPLGGLVEEIILSCDACICQRSAYWIALVAPRPWSRMILRNVCLNRSRLRFVDALLRMGVGVREVVLGCEDHDWFGNLDIRGRKLRPVHLCSDEVAAMIDEIPLLAVMAAKAFGVSTICRASCLRIEESDRLALVSANLRSMGVSVDERPEGIRIFGTGRLCGAEVDTFGDHQIGMAFSIAGLLAEDQATVIRNAGCVNEEFPNFRSDLCRLIGLAAK